MSQVVVTPLVRTAAVRPARPDIDLGRVARRAIAAVIVLAVLAAAWLGLLSALASTGIATSVEAVESGATALDISVGALVMGIVVCALVVNSVLATAQLREDSDRPRYDVR